MQIAPHFERQRRTNHFVILRAKKQRRNSLCVDEVAQGPSRRDERNQPVVTGAERQDSLQRARRVVAGATINRGTSATTEAVVEVLVVAGAFRASRNATPKGFAPAGQEKLHQPHLLGELGLPHAIRNILAQSAPLTPAVTRVMRFDFHYTTQGWRIAELPYQRRHLLGRSSAGGAKLMDHDR